MPHQCPLSVFLGQTAVGLLGKTSIVIVEGFHFFLEPSILVFLNFLNLFDVLFMLVFVTVEVNSSYRVEGDGWGHLLFEKVFVRVFSKPRMSQDFLDTMDRA